MSQLAPMVDPTSQGTTNSISQIIGNQQYADAPNVEQRGLRNQMTLQSQQGDIQSQQYAALNDTNLQRDAMERQGRMLEMQERDRLDRERISRMETQQKQAINEWKSFLKGQQPDLLDMNRKIAESNSAVMRAEAELSSSAEAASLSEDQFRQMSEQVNGSIGSLVDAAIKQGEMTTGAIGAGLAEVIEDMSIASVFDALMADYDEPLVSEGLKKAVQWGSPTVGLVVEAVKRSDELVSGFFGVKSDTKAKKALEKAEKMKKSESNVLSAFATKVGTQIDSKLGTAVGNKVARLLELHYLAADTEDEAVRDSLVTQATTLVGEIEKDSGHRVNAWALDQAIDQVVSNLSNPDSFAPFRSLALETKASLDRQGLYGKIVDEGGKQETAKRVDLMQGVFQRIGRKIAKTNQLIIPENLKQTPEKIQAHARLLMKQAVDQSPNIRAELRQNVDMDAILSTSIYSGASELRSLLKSIAANRDASAADKARVTELTQRLGVLREAQAALQSQREAAQFNLTLGSPWPFGGNPVPGGVQ